MNKMTGFFILFFGGISLILGVLCFVLTVYLLPYLFGWLSFEIPDFLLRFMPELAIAPSAVSLMGKIGIIIPFIVAGTVFLAISKYSSYLLMREREDDKVKMEALLEADLDAEQMARPIEKFRISPLIQIILGMILLLLLLTLAEYLLSVEFNLFTS